MSPPTRLPAIDDLERRRAFQEAASAIAARTARGKLGLVKRPGWAALASTEGRLSSADWRRAFAALLERDGVEHLCAVVLDSWYDEPAFEAPATEAGIASLTSRLGGMDHVIFPPAAAWAIVVTTEDIAALLGPDERLADLAGGDPASVRADLEDFLDDPDFWPAKQLRYFRSLIAAIESYDGAADGEIAELPIEL